MSRQVAETALTNLAIQVFAALTGILLARLLGADGRGDLATAIVWPTILAGIAVFGADVAFARLAASGAERLRHLYRGLKTVIALLSIPAMLAGFVLLPILLPPDKSHLLKVSEMLLLTIPASLTSVLCAHIALGLKEHRLFNGIRLSYSTVYLVSVMAVAVVTETTVLSAAICFLVAAFWAAAYGLVAMRFRMTTVSGPRVEVMGILRSAAPFSLVTTTQVLIANLPVALLTLLTDSLHVGYFVVAMVASSCHSVLGSAIGRMLFLKVCANGETPGAWISAVFRQSLVLYLLLAIFLCFLLPYIVPLLFGKQFGYSGILAIGLVIASSISALGSLLEEALRAKGRARPILLAQIASATSLLLLATLLVPSVGLKAMIWACIIGAVIQFIALKAFVTREFGIAQRDLLLVTKSDLRILASRLRSALAIT